MSADAVARVGAAICVWEDRIAARDRSIAERDRSIRSFASPIRRRLCRICAARIAFSHQDAIINRLSQLIRSIVARGWRSAASARTGSRHDGNERRASQRRAIRACDGSADTPNSEILAEVTSA
ncbi:hypothetical protein FV219_26930 [Methylobacterium sp. WL122]|nr:hypothetical protein FV219_26930 [Methylobacterium sp. WL122]